ncbi:MAG: hypothetical protein F4X19_15035 [Acidobacteria bacterium]|nr:hypothetical protein [Acidobacteriota bacterium]
MTINNKKIIEQALNVRTLEEATAVQDLIVSAIGRRHQRPLGDTWNNQGILTGSGASYDHKALEVVTNMQDAVLELAAIGRYGSRDDTPYKNPHDAASSLFAGLDRRSKSKLATVSIGTAGPGSDKKRVTLVMRDLGCGIAAADVPRGIFRVGTRNKDGIDWQQGTFGLGGATTYRNAKAVVLVTRRHPDLLEPDQDDLITVAVVQWERHRTTTNAYYLVTAEWDEDDPLTWARALPLSIPANVIPNFEPGTHLGLIAYDTAGFSRRSGDEKSFDTVLNTRLFRPVLPIQYRNNITRPDRDEVLDGLARRLEDNPSDLRTEGEDTLPFNHNSKTYHLPIRFYLFAKPGHRGQRRNFVAHGHALLISSNGQVHSHWTPQDFKLRTKLNKLYDRILVEVQSDALPIEIRTELFTADRAQLVRSNVAMRLEKEIAAFLNEWHELYEANKALIREAITGDNNDRPTIAIAEQIARAFKAKGFSLGGFGDKGGGPGPKPPNPTPPEDLYNDPTHLEGPDTVEAVLGKVKGIYFKLNAKDGFISRRAQPQVTCDHPDIGPAEITVGKLQKGRFRVAIAVPENADLGNYKLEIDLDNWLKTSGGLGPRFEWMTKIEIVENSTPHPPPKRRGGKKKGESGPDKGSLVALIWKSDTDDGVDWTPATVGEIEMVSGEDLAEKRAEYRDLAKVETEIPTIVLNRTYSPLKSYIQARAADLTDEGKERARERYAVGAGVALLVLDAETRQAIEKTKKAPDEAAIDSARRAAARGVLSVLPEYDRLAKELED